jgi:hypothetical protein
MLEPEIPFLERWWEETRDPSPRQRMWKQRHALAGVLAFERVGLLSAEQATRWRDRLTDPGDEKIDAGSELGAPAHAAAERFLADLVERLTPLRREPDPATIRQHAECDAAIEALHAVGVLDLYERASWYEASSSKKAPWRNEPLVPPEGSFAIALHVPPENEAQAERDAARAAAWEARPTAAKIIRVVGGGSERHRDLAIVGLVVHEDATALHFHYLGERQGDLGERERTLDSFQRVNERLQPPVLQDDEGRTYEPVGERPASSSGAGGIPDPDRREAITGRWLYTPAAPPSAGEFTVSHNEASWKLVDSSPR